MIWSKVKHAVNHTVNWPKIKAFMYKTIAMVIVDQVTKYLTKKFLQSEPNTITSFMRFSYTENWGISFGLLQAQSMWGVLGLLCLALSILFFLGKWYASEKDPWISLGIVLIIGGAFGNIIDRAFRGYVIDWIDLHWGTWHFPMFNFADTWITLGVLCILVRHIGLLTREGR